jgi:hypothetical protein
VTTADVEIRKPLRIGELIAAAIQIYGRRPLEFLALGLLQAAALLSQTVLPFAGYLLVVALAFGLAFAVTVRLVVGDSFSGALGRIGPVLPALVTLALFVGVPFSVAASFLIFVILAAAWLGLTAFVVPVTMVEEPEKRSFGATIAHAFRRTVELARVEYLHAFGVAAALIIVTWLLGVVLALALFSFAENGRVAAVAISQIVLSPFFFIGLTVLYFEQQARGLAARKS